MKNWLATLLAFLVLVVPSAYLLTDVMSASNSVHITAIVPEPSTPTEIPPSSSVTSSGSSTGSSGGGAFSSNTEASSSEASSESTSDANTAENDTGGDSGGVSAGGSSTSSNNTTGVIENTPSTPPPALPPPTAVVRYGGYTFPNATVTFSLNGVFVTTLQADATGYFVGSSSVPVGDAIFTFQASDMLGNDSRLTSYAYTVQNESPVIISSIVLPPLFDVSPAGDLSGVAIPGAEIVVYGMSDGDQELHPLSTITVNGDGTYTYDFDFKKDLSYDRYYVACSWEGVDCGTSGIVQVQMVGESNKFIGEVLADFTEDIEVNYVDFAFMRNAFLKDPYNPVYDLNQDGVVNLADFSLLNYQWSQ